MILFLSDLHLGRPAAGSERDEELDLIACLEHHRAEVEHLYLLGDVFDEYIEYRYLVPKGFVRLQGLLAAWTDAGIPVTYLVGNHDPWHDDYFERELGVQIRHEGFRIDGPEGRFFLSHGDDAAEDSPFKAWLKGWLRHPLPVRIYKTVLPADAGFGFARFVNRRFGTRALDRDLVNRLRVHARRILKDGTADVVIFGHSHHPELLSWPEGSYLNTGYWHESRSFGRLHNGTLQSVRWNGQNVEVVQEKMLLS